MKIKYTLQLLLPTAMLLLASCVEKIDMENFRTQPKLVLNTVALVNTPITASLSRTWFYTDNRPNVTIADARVELYVNDTFRELLVWQQEGNANYNSKGHYVATYCPAVSDRVRLVAKAEGFKEVSTETVLPQPSELVNYSISVKKSTDFENFYNLACRVTMKDDGKRDDYYLIRFESGSPILVDDDTWEYFWSPVQGDYGNDPIFNNDLTALDKVLGYDWLSGYNGRVFSDELINGKEYTFNFETTFSTNKPLVDKKIPHTYYPKNESSPAPPELMRVLLYSLSKDYYKYLKVLQTQSDGTLSNNLINAGLAEPIRVYSNVTGGLGICGGCNKNSLTAEIPEPK